MKMNKKGFTLIEMLVVIAIIAVLVSIVIPVVSSATDKAGAATNAANLRAVYAELQTDMLSAGANTEGYVTASVDATSGKLTYALATGENAPPASAKVGTEVAKNLPMVLTDGVLTYGGKTIEDFSAFSVDGVFPADCRKICL